MRYTAAKDNGIVLTGLMLLLTAALLGGENYLSKQEVSGHVLSIAIISEDDASFADENDAEDALSVDQEKTLHDILYQLIDMKEIHEKLISQYPNETVATWLAVSEELANAGLLADAKIILRRLEQADDSDVTIKFRLAKLFSSESALRDAIDTYREILTLQPNHQASQINLGLILARDNQHTSAVDEFIKAAAITSGEKRAKALAAAGDSYAALNNYSAAASMYQQSIQYRPAHAPTWRKLANAQLGNNESWQNVLTTINHALSLHPDYLLGRYDQARVLWLSQDNNAAKTALENLRQMAPEFTAVRWGLAHFYLLGGKPRSAAKHIHWLQKQPVNEEESLLLSVMQATALEEWPRIENIRIDINSTVTGSLDEKLSGVLGSEADWLNYYFANALLHRGGEGLAEAEKLATLVAADPALKSHSQILLADLALARGEPQRANRYVSDLLDINPQSASLYYKLGRMLLDQHQPAQAIKPLLQARTLAPDITQYQLSLALAYVRAGQTREAERTYVALLAKHPQHKIARFNFAVHLKKLGKNVEAISQYRKVLQIDPSYSNAQYNLAQLLSSQGAFTEAIHLYNDMLEVDPVYYAARRGLVNAYWQQQNYQQALVEVKRLLALQPDDNEALIQKFEILRDKGELSAAAEVVFMLPEAAFDELLVTKLYNLGVQALDAGNLGLAELCNKQVLKLDAQRDKALVNLSSVYNRSERFYETVSLLEHSEYLEINEKLSTNLAEAWFELGEYQKVVELLTPLKELAPLTSDANQYFFASIKKAR